MKINKMIDHTFLKATGTKGDIDTLINEAIEHDFASVCVNSSWVAYCNEKLKGSDVMVCTVVGFPLGAMDTESKVFETRQAIKNGADEIDMVINVGKMLDGDYKYVGEEIRRIVEAASGKTVKVIFETCLLTKDQIVEACKLSVTAGAHFVKTSTGFSTGGATVEDVELMKKTVGEMAEVKASGGVRSTEDLEKMIAAGATRIGTSSGVKLLNGDTNITGY